MEANPNRALLLDNGEEAVRYILDSSYESLRDAAQPVDAPPSDAQRLFVALASFATADVGREAALWVARDLQIAEGEAALGKLITLRLVDAAPNAALPLKADRERLRLHPLVQTYMRTLLSAWGEEDHLAAQRAVIGWYALYAQVYRQEFAALSADEANMAGAFLWEPTSVAAYAAFAINSDIDAGIKALFNYLFRGAHWRLGMELLRRQVAIRREAGNRSGEAAILNNLGEFARHRGRPDAARRYYEQALPIFREVGDRSGEAFALKNLGLLAESLGQSDEARRYYEQALAIFTQIGEVDSVHAVQANLDNLSRS